MFFDNPAVAPTQQPKQADARAQQMNQGQREPGKQTKKEKQGGFDQ